MIIETIQYRWLNESDLDKIAEIDRSEHITIAYNQEGSQLTPMAVDWQVPTWLSEGHGDHSLDQIIGFCSEHLKRGGIVKGAVVTDRLIGVGILHQDIRPSMDQLAFLHVSRAYRRRGIASEITRDLCRLARERGAKCIYVSATPSESAVSFYRNHGFESVTDHGFYWADDDTPQNFAQNKISLGATTDATMFNYTLTGLTPYTEYYFVAYAQNDSETKFGSVRSFKMENVWTRIGNFGGSARYSALAFSLNEFGYIAGGNNAAGYVNDFYRFSPDPENWISISTGSSPVDGRVFIIGNKAYVIDGNNLYEFDPNDGIWVTKSSFPGTGINMFVFSIGNRGYAGSGSYWDGSQDVYLNDFWEFNPQDDVTNGTDINGDPMGSWTQKVDFPGAGRKYGRGFSTATFGYVCSGRNDNNGDLNDFWQYDPFSTDNGIDTNGNPMGSWIAKPDYPGIPGSAQVSFIIRNKAYVFKGNELWQYNPVTENWKQLADFPGQSRFLPVGFAISNRGYIGTGTYNDGGGDIYLDDFWEYLPIQY